MKQFERRKNYSSFKDNICGADLADMELINKYNKGIRFLLCVIDLFSNYSRVVLLKEKKSININNGFWSILDNWKRKPNKIWVDQGSQFNYNSFKKWLKDNSIEMSSTCIEMKSVGKIFVCDLLTLLSLGYFRSVHTLGGGGGGAGSSMSAANKSLQLLFFS